MKMNQIRKYYIKSSACFILTVKLDSQCIDRVYRMHCQIFTHIGSAFIVHFKYTAVMKIFTLIKKIHYIFFVFYFK